MSGQPTGCTGKEASSTRTVAGVSRGIYLSGSWLSVYVFPCRCAQAHGMTPGLLRAATRENGATASTTGKEITRTEAGAGVRATRECVVPWQLFTHAHGTGVDRKKPARISKHHPAADTKANGGLISSTGKERTRGPTAQGVHVMRCAKVRASYCARAREAHPDVNLQQAEARLRTGSKANSARAYSMERACIRASMEAGTKENGGTTFNRAMAHIHMQTATGKAQRRGTPQQHLSFLA